MAHRASPEYDANLVRIRHQRSRYHRRHSPYRAAHGKLNAVQAVERVGWSRWIVAPLLLAGCPSAEAGRTSDSASSLTTFSGSATDENMTVDTETTAPDTSTTSNEPTGSSTPPTDGTSEEAETDEPKFDLGVQPDVNMEIDDGCQKVDFLFVIDNSGSMGDDQVNLVANFPAFINGIQATLEDVEEYHVGVVTSDIYAGNIPACRLLGGLVVSTGGQESSNMLCGPYFNGSNYMTQDDDLASRFACAAQVGSAGDGTERPMNAMEAAVRGDHAAPGACNEGFMRDDALLVVVVITDEYDGPGDPDLGGSSGDANSWYNTVVASKGGIAENIVVLTLTYINGGTCPPPDTVFNPGQIQTFAELFGENGFLGCINGDFSSIFAEATGVIADACDNFVPPG